MQKDGYNSDPVAEQAGCAAHHAANATCVQRDIRARTRRSPHALNLLAQLFRVALLAPALTDALQRWLE